MKKILDETVNFVKLEKPECVNGVVEAGKKYQDVMQIIKRVDNSKVKEIGSTHIRIYNW